MRLALRSAAGVMGPGLTSMPGRTRWIPSATTISPSFSPPAMTAVVGVDWPSWMRRCSTLLSAPTT